MNVDEVVDNIIWFCVVNKTPDERFIELPLGMSLI